MPLWPDIGWLLAEKCGAMKRPGAGAAARVMNRLTRDHGRRARANRRPGWLADADVHPAVQDASADHRAVCCGSAGQAGGTGRSCVAPRWARRRALAVPGGASSERLRCSQGRWTACCSS